VPDFTFDSSLGREVELYGRIDGNDPTNSAFVLVVLAESGLESDSALRVYTNLGSLLAGASNEVTNTGYARKTLTDADLSAYTVDTSNHRITLSLPTQTWSTISAGDSWSKLLVCYDSDTTSGTDSNVVPVTGHDLRINNAAIVPNGSDVVVAFTSGFVIAT
jgi:hypothetical protein